MRRLERVQLLAIVAGGLAMLVGAAALGSSLAEDQRRAAEAASTRAAVDALRDQMRAVQVRQLEYRLGGGGGVAPETEDALLDARRQVEDLPAIMDPESPAGAETRAELTAALDEALALVRLAPRSVAAGSPADLVSYRLSAPIVARLDQAGRAWSDVARREATQLVDRAEAGTRRAKLWGIGAALVLLAGGCVAAVNLARSRRRLADDLETGAKRLQHLSQTDSQTGLANHRRFREELTVAVERTRRGGRPLSLAMIDVDHFKRINDAHGHPHGDRVLAALAHRLQSLVPDSHLVARIGGEEFAWLMPGLDELRAVQLADQVRSAVATRPLTDAGEAITISCGVAELGTAEDDVDLVRRADRALYVAKDLGRDAVAAVAGEVPMKSAPALPERLERLRDLAVLKSLAASVDAKHPSSRRHSQRVADLAARTAEAAGWAPETIASLHQAAMVHDIGKVGVPDEVLLKDSALDAADWERMRRHPELGADMLENVLTPSQLAWVRHHHERWDGLGYPDGRSGDEIPPGAGIIAVAEAWDAMTIARGASPPLPRAEAVAEIRRQAGRQFCPKTVATFLRVIGETGGSDGEEGDVDHERFAIAAPEAPAAAGSGTA